jgi:hypothetical protein
MRRRWGWAAAWYRVRHDARRGWRVVAASAFLLGVAGGIALTAFIGAWRTESVYHRLERATNAPDVAVLPTTPQAMGTITADRLRMLPGVKSVGAGAGFLALRPSGGGLTSSLLQPTDGVVFEQVQRPVVRQGRLPDPHRYDEVFANPAGQAELGVVVGESFELIVLPEFSYKNPITETFEQINADVSAGKIGQRRRFTLVGVGITTDDIVRPTSGTIVFTKAFYDETHAGPAYVGFVVRLEGGRASLPAFQAAVDQLAPGQQVSFQTAAAQEDSVSRTLRPQVLTLTLFALVVALVSIASWSLAVVRQMRVDVVDDAVCEAIGMDRRSCRAVQILGAALVAPLAAVVAVTVAVIGSWFMPIADARRIEPQPGVYIDGWVLGLGAITLVVATVATASVLSLAASGRRRTSAAIGDRHWSGTVRRLLRRPSVATGIVHAIDRGDHNNPLLSRVTMVAAVFGTALVVGVATLSVDLDHFLYTPHSYGWGFDVGLTVPFNDAAWQQVLQGVDTRAATDPAVAGRASSLAESGLIGGRPEVLLGIDQKGGSAVSPTIVAGRAPNAATEIALGARTERALHVGIGQKVQVGRTNATETFTVVGTVVLPSLSPTSSDPPGLGSGGLLTLDGLRNAFHLVDTRSGSVVLVDLLPGADPVAFVGRMGGVADEFGRGGGVIAVGPGLPPIRDSPVEPQEVSAYRTVRSTPLVLAVVLGLLAAATVAQSLVVSVRRRRREFATLRALGFTSSQVRSAVSWQATTVAVTGVIIGMPLGLLAGREAWRAVANQLGVPEHASVPRLLLLLVLPVAVLAINIVGIFAAHRAGRCTPAEALRDE